MCASVRSVPVIAINLQLHTVFIIGQRHDKNRIFAYVKRKAQISRAVSAQLISAFVFAKRMVQFFHFLNPNVFQVPIHLLWLYSLVYLDQVGNQSVDFLLTRLI